MQHTRRLGRRPSLPSCILALFLLIAVHGGDLSAHDRHGNVAMHQDVRVQFAPHGVTVTFALETNDEGRIIEAIAMDANGDGKLTPDEQAAYFAQLDARLREGLQINVAGADVPLSPSNRVELSPPARKTFSFQSAAQWSRLMTGSVEVYNDNFPDWPGRTTLHLEGIRGTPFTETHNSGTSARGFLGVGSPPTAAITWSRWTWPGRLLHPESLRAPILCFGPAVFMLIARHWLTGRRRLLVWVAVLACSSTSLLVPLPWQAGSATPEPWIEEFRHFHERLTTAIAGYHQDGNHALLSPFGSQSAMKRLANNTRVAETSHDKSAVLELRRVRPLATSVLSVEEGVFQTTVRIHHKWRAIGIVRHFGHPHERARDFACDYTLRVTDQGFQVLDCSEWDQMPDEPVE